MKWLRQVYGTFCRALPKHKNSIVKLQKRIKLYFHVWFLFVMQGVLFKQFEEFIEKKKEKNTRVCQ